MSRALPRRTSRILGALALALTLGLTACATEDPTPTAAPDVNTASTDDQDETAEEVPFNSEFSRDGTYQSHQIINGIDFVYTLWAAKTTPRMQQWYAAGDKYFSFTFQAYDTRQRLRDPFRTKRRVWLDRIRVTSITSTESGAAESPYRLNEYAADITFDPEARQLRPYGMLVTSPKGAFELRNQVIKTMAEDTEGITLSFTATVHVQDGAGSRNYSKRVIRQEVPIAIFESDEPTVPQPVPYNAS